MHAFSGIRTHDPRNQAAEDICVRCRDYRYRRDHAYIRKNHFLDREAGYSILVNNVFEKPAASIPRY